MIVVQQKSDRNKFWYDASVTDNGDGTLTFGATTVYRHGVAYALAAYTTPNLGTDPFALYVEPTGGSVDYLLSFFDVLTDAPLPWPNGEPGVRVAWRDGVGAEIHALRSVVDA